MKKSPQHHHIFVIKSCLKSSESSSSTGYQVETENSSWMRQRCDEYLVHGETLLGDIAPMAAMTKKRVRFAKLARCKGTLARKQYTKQEYGDTWYSRRELRALNRRSEMTSDEDDHGEGPYPQSAPSVVSCSRQSQPPALAYHVPNSKRGSAGSPTLRVVRPNQPSAKLSEGRARLMRLNTYTTLRPPSDSTNNTRIFPSSPTGMVRSNQKEEEEDWVMNEPRAFSARNRQSSSIFYCVLQKIKHQSASIMPNKKNCDMMSGASSIACAEMRDE